MKHIKTCCGQSPMLSQITFRPIDGGDEFTTYFYQCRACSRKIDSGSSYRNGVLERIGYMNPDAAEWAWNNFIELRERK